MKDKYTLLLNTSQMAEIDRRALLASQDYNLGNVSDWFGAFRGGLFGMHAKVYGATHTYKEIHSWISMPRHQAATEYQVATFLFCIDSALECLVFAMNALGFAVSPTDFHDPADAKALRRIVPNDLISDIGRASDGFLRVFPKACCFARANSGIVLTLTEQHDVSKHRSTVCQGGQARMDPPVGFFDSIGLAPDDSRRFDFSPWDEVILLQQPKLPTLGRVPVAYEDRVTLEELAKEFEGFFNAFCEWLLYDVKHGIILKHDVFLTE